jgi:hypothetical protein
MDSDPMLLICMEMCNVSCLRCERERETLATDLRTLNVGDGQQVGNSLN